MATARPDVQPTQLASARDAGLLEIDHASGTQPVPDAPPTIAPDLGRSIYLCPCGHRLRVSGVGRHRVYFEPGPAGAEEAVMDRRCPACGLGLPGKNP